MAEVRAAIGVIRSRTLTRSNDEVLAARFPDFQCLRVNCGHIADVDIVVFTPYEGCRIHRIPNEHLVENVWR